MAHLSYEERVEIHSMRRLGSSLVEIGRHLGRHASTIGRELKRNISARGIYLPSTADNLANKRRRIPSVASKLEQYPELFTVVTEKLALCWSPEQISGWLKKENHEYQISPQTIYRFLSQLPSDHALRKAMRRRGKRIDVKNRALSNPGFEIASRFMIGRNWSRSVSVLGTGSSISSDAIGAVAISLRLLIE